MTKFVKYYGENKDFFIDQNEVVILINYPKKRIAIGGPTYGRIGEQLKNYLIVCDMHGKSAWKDWEKGRVEANMSSKLFILKNIGHDTIFMTAFKND
jgi:hypothetical protein